MEYRTGAVAVVGLLVVGLGASFLVGPSATETADRFTPTVERGTSNGSLYTAGEVFEERSITVGERGAVRTRATIGNTTGIRYWNGSNESVYRVEAENESPVDRVASAYNESQIVDRSETVVVVEEVQDRPAPEEWWNGSLVMVYLQAPEYERVGTETRGNDTVVVYEPTSAYVRIKSPDEQTVRVSAPAGEAVVDAGTGQLLSANVSYEVVRAESWGGYLQSRATGESVRIRVTYEYQSNSSVTPVNRNAS